MRPSGAASEIAPGIPAACSARIDNSGRRGSRRLDDRRPAGKFISYQSSQWLLSALRLPRNVAAEFEQTLAGVLVIQRLVKRICELVKDWVRRPVGHEQGIPG